MNILVADRTIQSIETDSRNGSGKSSLIEIIHFDLGMSRLTDSVLSNAALKPWAFTLELDWPGRDEPVSVTRAVGKKSRVDLEPNVVEQDALVEIAGDASVPEWLEALGRVLFGLPPEHPSLSARSLLALYVRRVSQHAFNDPVKTFAAQSAAEASTNVAYLLGLDWRLAAAYQELAGRESMRAKLKQAMKDPSFGLMVGSVSELRGLLASARHRLESVEAQVQNFRVVPAYEKLQATADQLDAQIRQIRRQDAADRRNLEDLEAALRSEREPDTRYLERAYAELGIQLPLAVLKRYEDVTTFHASVLANRAAYLSEELAATRERLSRHEALRATLGGEQAALLRLLNEGGALDSLAALQEQLSTARAEVARLTDRFETAMRLEITQAEIKVERSKIQQSIGRDLSERESMVSEINLLFQRFATSLYGADREAYIAIEPLDKSLRIAPHIGGENSRGIGNMVIFCFDLTVAVLAHRAGRGPDFLVHDSHLFDGVDERQVAKALNLAAQVCEEEGLQYIATVNSDDLEKAESTGSTFAEFVIEPRLTDAYDDGGLFGFHFD